MSSGADVPPIAGKGTHARRRYLTRAHDNSLTTYTPGEIADRIRRCWRNGIPVGMVGPRKDNGRWRLHPPTETVVAARDGYIRTVLCRPPDCDLVTEHLWHCGDCGEFIEPPDDVREREEIPDCRWCGADSGVIVHHD
jgi:hypothetical protein